MRQRQMKSLMLLASVSANPEFVLESLDEAALLQLHGLLATNS